MDIYTKKKILLLLSGGGDFAFSYYPHRKWRAAQSLHREWKKISEEKLKEEIRNLYRSKLVSKKENSDGSITLKLTNKGRMRALTYRFEDMEISSKGKWDGKWRIVLFDIPETRKRGRDALRQKLKQLGFAELQKSVFVLPFECEQEIEFIIEFFSLKPFVRYGVLDVIDNNLHLKKIFGLR